MGVVAPQLDLRDLLARACRDCLDTTVATSLYGPEPCTACLTSGKKVKPVATRLADYVWRRAAAWKEEDARALVVARLFNLASSQQPFTGPVVSAYLGLGARELKASVETIRNAWKLPLVSRRKGGGGYWYAENAEQLRDWWRTLRSQAVSELATGYGLVRANYPELAGQDNLDFIKSFSEELQEALR